jgi:transaldolase/transaldolase/glucose-6-phosphate isomerase
MRPIEALEQLGQSVWLDTIDRELLTSGGLRRLIEQEGVRGVTTNPTIFEHALTHGTAYDAAVAGVAPTQPDPAALFESLAEPKRIQWVEGADHFFTGRLEEVQKAIEVFLKEIVVP